MYVYDNSEPSNCEAWKRLPSFYQEFITNMHNDLVNCAVDIFKDKYCVEVTSGFRSPAVNKRVGGVADSLHLHGLAIDFILLKKDRWLSKVDLTMTIDREFLSKLNYDKNRYTLIFETNHFHLQFNRKS